MPQAQAANLVLTYITDSTAWCALPRRCHVAACAVLLPVHRQHPTHMHFSHELYRLWSDIAVSM